MGIIFGNKIQHTLKETFAPTQYRQVPRSV